MSNEISVSSLYLDFARSAQVEVSGAIEYVRSDGGGIAADRFADRVAEVFRKAAARIAEEVAGNENGKPFDQTDAAASTRWAQPVYRLRVETATKRRRSSSVGLWYAYYSLRDRTDTGKPDTLFVHAFVHSAARPIGSDGGTGE